MDIPSPVLPAPSQATLDRLAAVVGAQHSLRDPLAMEPYLREWRGLYVGRAALVLRPGSVEDVSRILAIADETRTAIVPQGGGTGLVGGQVPFESGHEVVLSLARLNRIRELDPLDNTMTVEAGCVLAEVQRAADAAERLFPLSLAAEGSCQIGGNLSTNAGGIQVLAYGNARELCLGLEVVLADGRVWNGLRRLRKDNTGYALKDLFIGAEGTLGVVTAAVLKLFPKPRDKATALAGVARPADAVALFALAGERGGGQVTAFELMPRIALELSIRHAGGRDPLQSAHPWYVLVELAGGEARDSLRGRLEGILESALERELIADATLAQSDAQAAELWRHREALSELQGHEGGSIKHDISVPVSRVPAFLEQAIAACQRLIPGCRPVPFGHLGDGNIHFNVSQPAGADRQAFLARWDEVNAAVHGIVLRLGGSISAEHGIGRLKRELMREIKAPLELELMRGLKHLFDPNGILNPGKLLPPG